MNIINPFISENKIYEIYAGLAYAGEEVSDIRTVTIALNVDEAVKLTKEQLAKYFEGSNWSIDADDAVLKLKKLYLLDIKE